MWSCKYILLPLTVVGSITAQVSPQGFERQKPLLDLTFPPTRSQAPRTPKKDFARPAPTPRRPVGFSERREIVIVKQPTVCAAALLEAPVRTDTDFSMRFLPPVGRPASMPKFKAPAPPCPQLGE